MERGAADRWDAAKALRRKGLELLSLIQKITMRRRVEGCCRNRFKGGEVAIYVKDGVPYFAGLQRCASIWNCPACATKISGVRRAEIERVGTLHVERGGSIAALTLTTSHYEGMNGRELRKVIGTAWRMVQQNRAYRDAKRRLGLVGTLRALEVTHGQNGFHPHIHLALFFSRDFGDKIIKDGPYAGDRLPSREMEGFAEIVFNAWSSAIVQQGYPSPSREHGLKLQMMRPGSKAWGAYLTKIGFEFAAAHHKSGRHGNRSMWQVAADAAYEWIAANARGEVTDFATDDGGKTYVPLRDLKAAGYLALPRSSVPYMMHPDRMDEGLFEIVSTIPDVTVWRDFEAMIHGARQLEWSRGMRKLYQVDTQTDLEIIDAPVEGTRLVTFPKPVWLEIRRRGPGGLADLLEAAMEGPSSLFLTLYSWGFDVSNDELRWGPLGGA